MPAEPAGIHVSGVTKVFGEVRAVDNLTFAVEPGLVTGFLGPNGAGKTTTLRVVLGLAKPNSGTATINGLPYARLSDPGLVVGAVLESTSFHPGRTGLNHLRVYAAAAGVPDGRADEVLALVGLTAAGRNQVRGYSLGMRQRLGLATAMLGDPRVLILDEPANGLDPEGIVWLRSILRHLAHDEGRTVLVSSHVLSEVEQTVDQVVIIARGRLVHSGLLSSLRHAGDVTVVVETPTPQRLADALTPLGVTVISMSEHSSVTGTTAEAVGHAAWNAQVELHGLAQESSSLETVFLQLTEDHSTATAAPPNK